ncbi:MAG: DUF389 domain-containing protein [Bacteroidales bacterium]|nr:DUF389 domain-containing protein [Bacteroidales bacterium]
MTFFESIKHWFKSVAFLGDEIDTADAARRIKGGIWFRGANVWILAFSIVIASVGLNVNSTAVIIGAMLVSPLMGPIIGMGLSMGTNDTELLKDSVRNLLIMVAISLVASTLYFLMSPLKLVNPTELEARTSPSFFDVLIALFGGLAGILENCRKERGTVISGVAIATALMPPLCTAGYGLAHWNFHFFGGAMFLFLINAAFISLATYLVVILLHFKPVAVPDQSVSKRKIWMGSIVLPIIGVSVFTAASLIQDNNFHRSVDSLVDDHRTLSGSFIYDYDILDSRKAVLYLSGEKEEDVLELLTAAPSYGIKPEQLEIRNHAFQNENTIDYEALIEEIYSRAMQEISGKDATISRQEAEISRLRSMLPDSLERADSLSE